MACEFSRRGGVVTLQEKTVTASASGAVSVSPDSGYNGLSKVTVNQVLLQDRTITPASLPYTVSPTGSYVGLRRATINKDSNLVAGNIKKGVSIFGVAGTYGGSDKIELSSSSSVIALIGGTPYLELTGVPSTAADVFAIRVLNNKSGSYVNTVSWYYQRGWNIQDYGSSFVNINVAGFTALSNPISVRIGFVRYNGKIYLYAIGYNTTTGSYSITLDPSGGYSFEIEYT